MSAALRLSVRKRAGARCEYCRLPDLAPDLMRFHLEHIRARRHGGRNSLMNLAWACARCNERKGPNLSGVDPDTDRAPLQSAARRMDETLSLGRAAHPGPHGGGSRHGVASGIQFRRAAQAPAGTAQARPALNGGDGFKLAAPRLTNCSAHDPRISSLSARIPSPRRISSTKR